ncbi:sensor histidine kinase [Falsirhodobacter sp. 20TX0035]|uniref:sensor histidine kinase n=1 Tax=Falsirhodobacter sp. 20TX0035 TaxID=3022019 RepID=UPI00232C5BCE|nr:HWE histidine kinase domain-containing protein [Falsirhodobacter sp. 20TX0035]MDB6452885.1 HWE histidine kinase domain-containing protein [Falsirhodobacter sp. 20TX0035]
MSISPEALADLQRRLQEAEDTLRAIREGEVDALVVGRMDQPQVFAIGGDAEGFRAFIEVMDTGAAAVDDTGRVLYANATFAELVNAPAPGRALADLLAADPAEVAGLLADDTSPRATLQVTQYGPAGARFLVVASKPLQIGTVAGHAITLSDVTDRVRTARAEQNERTAQGILASVNEAVLVCDADGIVTRGNAASRALYADDPVGRAFADIVPLVPAQGGLADSRAILERAMTGPPVQGMEVFAPDAPGAKDFLLSAAPLRMGEGAASGCVVTMVDMTQRKAAERQQLLLMNELDHRVKNALAMVIAITRRTIRTAGDLATFEKTFTDRVRALAATHNLLAKNAWKGLTVQNVVVAELSPFMDMGGQRITTEGLDTLISAEAAVAIGLVFHELATNAVKYGALSSDTGSIAIRALDGGAEGALVLEWRETGGPVVSKPTHGGFGETVITQSLAFAQGGGATLDYDPAGVICTLTLPPEHLPAV